MELLALRHQLAVLERQADRPCSGQPIVPSSLRSPGSSPGGVGNG